MKVLITGGAGFVGSSLALALGADPGTRVTALDNLKRRGSELAPARLAAAGVRFLHGDTRCLEDIEAAGPADLIIDCAAEPSVQAGLDGQSRYLVGTNLGGTVNCLEAARQWKASFVLLSTSRVYSVPALRALPLATLPTRLDLPETARGPGWSAAGITRDFPVTGPRSLYGATKLASELLVEDYAALYDMPAIIDRCGVIAGPWQMGKVDQGFFVLWAARHLYGGQLSYNGFGGAGRQVRDVLHVADLADLVRLQIAGIDRHRGTVFNVGGGQANAVSLAELTRLCEAETGNRIAIAAAPETNPVDIAYYVTDNAAVTAATGWQPKRSIATLLGDVMGWLGAERERLAPILGGNP